MNDIQDRLQQLVNRARRSVAFKEETRRLKKERLFELMAKRSKTYEEREEMANLQRYFSKPTYKKAP